MTEWNEHIKLNAIFTKNLIITYFIKQILKFHYSDIQQYILLLLSDIADHRGKKITCITSEQVRINLLYSIFKNLNA